MKEQFKQYVINLYQDVPTEVYEGLLSIFCLGAVGLIAFLGWKRGWRKVVGLLLAEYVFLIYCATVIYRKVSEGVVGHNFHPFWSYEAIKNGKEDLIAENIMNAIVFIPIGMILGSLFLRPTEQAGTPERRVKGAWLIALIAGMGISVSIEAMQFFFKRGFSEVDDVFHNVLGAYIGIGLYKLGELSVKWLIHRIK